jgi:hypothetical protein
LAEGVLHIPPPILHPVHTARVPACLCNLRKVTEFAARFETGFIFIHAAGNVFFRELLQVE